MNINKILKQLLIGVKFFIYVFGGIALSALLIRYAPFVFSGVLLLIVMWFVGFILDRGE